MNGNKIISSERLRSLESYELMDSFPESVYDDITRLAAAICNTPVSLIASNQLNEPSINGIVANSRDVTDRKLYLKATEEQNAKLKEIAWTQSHIVRAPVARLMGLINLVREDVLENEEKELMLDNIIKSADEIDAIIKQIVESTASVVNIEKIE